MGKLVVLMITAFIDMVGTLMIIPLMPFYAKSFGANGLVVGLLVSSFSIAQLLSAPIWGRFSDRYGRRPALVVGMMASAIAYVDLRVRELAVAALPVAPRSRVGRRDCERDSGLRRRRGGSPSSARRDSAGCRRRRTPASRSGRCSAPRCCDFGPHGPGIAAAILCVVNIDLRAQVPG